MSITLLVFIRSVFAFITLFIFTRLIGKQQISELTVFEYLVGLTIGGMASAMSVELQIESINGVVGITLWGMITLLLATLTFKSPWFRRFIQGEPRVLIRNGRIVDQNLRKERIDLDQLMMLLRQKDVFSVQDVEYAVLEVNGKLSVLPKADKRPVTPYDMKLPVQNERPAITLVKDGHVNHHALMEAGLDMAWLEGNFQKQGITSVTEVLLAQVNSNGQLFLDRKDEWQENLNPGYENLINKMYQLQADLHQYCLETADKKVMRDYTRMKNEVDRMLQRLENYIAKQS